MNNEEYDDLTERIDALPNSRKIIALERACKKIGVDYTRLPSGVLEVDTDLENEDLLEEFTLQLQTMIVDDVIDDLVKDGLAEPRVLEDGGLAYSITEKGKKALEQNG